MDSRDEIEELRARVEKIEGWIRAFIRQSQDAEAEAEHPSSTGDTDAFEIVSLDIKDVSRSDGLPTYAYRLQVRNLTDESLTLLGKISFLDDQGFEIDTYPVGPIKIRPAHLHVASGQATLLSDEKVSEIDDIKAVLQRIG